MPLSTTRERRLFLLIVSVGATVVCHTYRRVGWLPFRHVCVQGTTVDISGEKKSDEEENMIQVDVIISPPSLGAPPNYFSSEAVTVASQLHLGRVRSEQYAWFPFVEPSPSKVSTEAD